MVDFKISVCLFVCLLDILAVLKEEEEKGEKENKEDVDDFIWQIKKKKQCAVPTPDSRK